MRVQVVPWIPFGSLTVLYIVWLRIHLSGHPSFPRISTEDLVVKLWEQIADADVLLAPGTMFSGVTFGDDASNPTACIWGAEGRQEEELAVDGGDGFFRLAFSTASEKEMRTAMKTVGEVVAKFFKTEV